MITHLQTYAVVLGSIVGVIQLITNFVKKTIFLAVLISLPLVSFASIDANLKYGNTGTEVSELQEFLVSKGFLNTQPTGNFYSLTLAAVKEYQASVNVPNTGYVGPMTRAAINDELAANLKSSNDEEASLPPSPTPSPSPVTPSPVPTPTPIPVFGNVSNPPSTPTYTVVTNVHLGNEMCSGVGAVSIPLEVTGNDWDHIDITYQDFATTARQDGISKVVMSQRQNKTVTVPNIAVYNIRYSNPTDNMTPSFNVLNVPASYDVTGVIYDRNKNVAGNFNQTISVDSSCRTADTEITLPMVQ